MKRTELVRRTPLSPGTTQLRRTPMPPRPQWTAEEWADADIVLHERARNRCESCGLIATNANPFERHHRVRRRDGGDRLANLLLLHSRCHAYWTEHPAEARARGITVLVGTDPATVPIYRGISVDRATSGPPLYLDDDGGTHHAPVVAP